MIERNRLFAGMALVTLLAGCASDSALSLGDPEEGLKPMPDCKVSPEQAAELAKPHLQRCFELRQQKRPGQMNSKGAHRDMVFVKDDWYYVCRDNYTTIFADFYLPHAVRVHTQTGEVKEPQ
jgi:hypothetical protein